MTADERSMIEVRPVCIFCQQRFSLAAGEETVCEDPRNEGRHVEWFFSTKEDKERLRRPPVAPEPPAPPTGQGGLF